MRLVYIYIHTFVTSSFYKLSIVMILRLRIHSGPCTNIIMLMRINVSPGCACTCQLTTVLIVTDMYIYVNRSLIQSLALMCSANMLACLYQVHTFHRLTSQMIFKYDLRE